MEEEVNSLLFIVSNDGNVEDGQMEQETLEESWSGTNKMRTCFETCKQVFLREEELKAAFNERKQLSKQSD